jgi:hypothetical protein
MESMSAYDPKQTSDESAILFLKAALGIYEALVQERCFGLSYWVISRGYR